MRTIPLDVVFSWPAPNYESPHTRGPALVIVNSILIALVIVVVGLRLYTRLIIKRWFGVDDVLILLALIFTIGLTAIVLLANQNYGWDRHVYDIQLSKLAPTSKIAMSAKVVFTAAATFTRLSLLFFYYRLVSDSGKRFFVWAIHINVAYSIGILISFTFLAIFLCNPVHNYWVYGAAEHSCLDEGVVTLTAGIINCVADFFCTITPIPMVMRLQMPKRQRIAVAVLFGLGFIVTIAGIVRTWYIYKSLITEYDQTWYAYPLWIAAAVEIDLGVICASAPVLRPLLIRIPINLSHFSTRLSKMTGYGTNSSSANPAGFNSHASRTFNSKIAVDSNHPPETADGPKSDQQNTANFELRQWDDVERGLRTGISSRGSQDAILGSDDGQCDSQWRKGHGDNGFTRSNIPTTLGEDKPTDRRNNWGISVLDPIPGPIRRPSPSAHAPRNDRDWPLRPS